MATLTEPFYGTKRKDGVHEYTFPVAASVTIYAGSIVAADASGNAMPASNGSAAVILGRAKKTADNASGSAGDIDVIVESGHIAWDNASTTPVAVTDIGLVAKAEDDTLIQAPAGIAGANLPIGRVMKIDGTMVWVNTEDRA